MRSKKVIALLISLTLLVSIALPGTLAVSIDQDAASSSVTLTSGKQETPTPAPEEQQEQKDQNEQENICTCGSTDGTHQEGCPLYVEQTEALEEVEIRYQVVGPENCGTLNIESERLPLPGIGTGSGSAGESLAGDDLNPSGNSAAAHGAEPTAAEGFRFVGWYKDEACTQPVDVSWVSDNGLIPGKTKNYGTAEAPVMGYEAATYYARFENETASLTITKSGVQDIDENQSFLFDVTGPDGYSKRVVINGNGSVTIKGLKIGKYTVTEVTGWSWRYTPDSETKLITLKATGENSVTFANTRSSTKWLDGNAYCKNEFKNK